MRLCSGQPLLLLIIRLELRRRGGDVIVGGVIVRVGDGGVEDGNGSVGRVDVPPSVVGGSMGP